MQRPDTHRPRFHCRRCVLLLLLLRRIVSLRRSWSGIEGGLLLGNATPAPRPPLGDTSIAGIAHPVVDDTEAPLVHLQANGRRVKLNIIRSRSDGEGLLQGQRCRYRHTAAAEARRCCFHIRPLYHLILPPSLPQNTPAATHAALHITHKYPGKNRRYLIILEARQKFIYI